jgi:rhodanese-related sulfurtransferase
MSYVREEARAEQLAHYEGKLAYEIDAWDLAQALAAGERVLVVDARSREAFRREHIPGALSLPHRAMEPGAVAGLDRGALVVTYCDGIGCNASTKGALRMLRLGFRVKELIGGLDWWKRDGHPTHGEAAAAASGACGCE